MPSVPAPYELVGDIRRRAEQIRMQNVRQAVRGSIAARSITADKIAVGTLTSTEIQDASVLGADLVAGTIAAREIAAGSITADRLSVGSLSAISANLGTVTAGAISGATIQLGSGSPHIFGDSTGIRAVGSGAAYRFFADDDSTRTGSVRCNLPSGFTQVELAAYVDLNPAGGTKSGLRTRDTSDAEQGFVTVNGGGTVAGSSAYINSSDRKIKDAIKDVNDPLEAIKALRPRKFRRKRSGLPDAGFVAQELEPVLPDLVHHDIDENGNMGIAYDGLHAYTIAALQNVIERLERLERS